MLQKRIDLGSIPFGLYKAKDDLVKGRLVKFNHEKAEVEYATSDDDAVGFATLYIDTPEGATKDHDTIKKGARTVVYTLVKNNVWATTEVDGIDTLKAGDKLKASADGKLAKGEGKFVVVSTGHLANIPAVDVMYVG